MSVGGVGDPLTYFKVLLYYHTLLFAVCSKDSLVAVTCAVIFLIQWTTCSAILTGGALTWTLKANSEKNKQASKQTNYTDLGAQPLLGEGYHPPPHKEEEEEEEEDSPKNDCGECYTFLG